MDLGGDARDRFHQHVGIGSRAQRDAHPVAPPVLLLAERQISGGELLYIEAGRLDVARHPDDGDPTQLVSARPAKAFAYGRGIIIGGDDLADERFVHDRDREGTVAVELGKRTPLDQRNSHDAKVVRADPAVENLGLGAFHDRLAFDRQVMRNRAPSERKIGNRRDALDTGQRTQPLEHAVEEYDAFWDVAKLRKR